MERLNIKLSFYHSINKNLKKELLELMLYYPDQVEEIEFNQDSDLFVYKIKNATLDKQNSHSRNMSTFKLSNSFIKSKSFLETTPKLPPSPIDETESSSV